MCVCSAAVCIQAPTHKTPAPVLNNLLGDVSVNIKLIFSSLLLQVWLRGGVQRRRRAFAHAGEVLREDRPVSDHLQRRPAPHQVRVRLRDARGGLLCALRGLQDRCVCGFAAPVVFSSLNVMNRCTWWKMAKNKKHFWLFFNFWRGWWNRRFSVAINLLSHTSWLLFSSHC